MTVDSKMTAIADEIRVLSGTTDSMGLDLMASHIGDANDNIDIESDLILQITDALNNKAGGTSLNFEVVGNPKPSNPKENTIWVNTDVDITEWRFARDNPYTMPQEITGFDISREGYYIAKTNEEVYDTDWNITGIIPIPDGTKSITIPTISEETTVVAHRFLDENLFYLSTVKRNSVNSTYTVPEGAKAIQASLHVNDPGYIIANFNDSMTKGTVWISTGSKSPIEFNVLKNNGIQVYPLYVKQYINGVWVTVEAKSYQNGEWIDWVTYLYNKGETQYTFVSAAKKNSSSGSAAGKATTITLNDDNVYMTLSSSSTNGNASMVYLDETVDLTEVSTVYVEGDFFGQENTKYPNLRIWSKIGTYVDDNLIASTKMITALDVEQTNLIELDVSELSGKYYIGFGITAFYKKECYARIRQIYMK